MEKYEFHERFKSGGKVKYGKKGRVSLVDIVDIMKMRRSVRNYNDEPITADEIESIQKIIAECNREGNLNMQLCMNDPAVFESFTARYGKLRNVKNYIACVGKKSSDLDKRIGYYGEKVVLKATETGLKTCWVARLFSRSKCKCNISEDEKLICIISIGHADNNGASHKVKPIEKLCELEIPMPEWFRKGMEAAQLAPTAMNQQKFTIILNADGTVSAKAGIGILTAVDLGIVKCHFELGCGKDDLIWK